MKQLLKDIATIGAGQGAHQGDENYCNKGIPFVKAGNLQELLDGKDINNIQQVSKEVAQKHKLKLYPKGTILFAKSGMSCMKGFVYVLPQEAYVVSHLACITPNDDVSEYLRFYFNFHRPNRLVKDAAYPSISLSDIGNLEIDMKTEFERTTIIKQLRCIESVISLRQQELCQLDDLIKARFVEMFGSIHDGKFEMKTLPEIVSSDKNSIKRGPFGGALKKDDFVAEGYLVYEQRHAIHNDFEYAKYYITQEKYEDMIGFKVVPGDLIISCSGVTLGRIAEVPNGAKEGIINQALLKLSLNQELMMNTFFIQQFRGEEIQEILFGFSRGSGIPNMPSMSEVKAVKFVCPPLELQKQYCDFVHQVDKSKVVVQKALDEAETLMNALMQKYFG